MVLTTIKLEDLITRLKAANAREIWVEVDEIDPGVYKLPLSFIYGITKDTGLLQLLEEDSGMLQVGPVLDAQEASGVAGVDAVTLGLAGQIWEIRSVSITSNAGATYALQDDGVIVAPAVAVGAGATGELVNVAIPVAGGSAITVDNGAALDMWNLRAVRLK